jgi:hypothetical protein
LFIRNCSTSLHFAEYDVQALKTRRGAIQPIADFETAEVERHRGSPNQIFDLDACTRCGQAGPLPGFNTENRFAESSFRTKAEWEKTAGCKNEDGLLIRLSEETSGRAQLVSVPVNCHFDPTFDKNIEMRRISHLR